MKIKGMIHLQITGLILIGFLLSLNGCVTSQLSQFKKHYDSQEYTWIAEQEVSCSPSEEGCNQLHLIKGNACYELATHGQSPLRYFECSATHLEMGIDQTRQWQLEKFNLNRPQNHENLGESLRRWRDLEKGAKAT
ncbi:MAG: hypothetical protein HY730_10250, partial [Candidatus Tectomicrobia bacterium]|nr:hypothetical protein [Candidatus Tectomicrobia bacterium]